MENEEILALFFARDEQAIRETEAKYGKTLRGLSQRITGNPQDAEECVNDAYLSAWKQIPPEKPMNYYAWLCRVVRNISLSVVEKNTAGKRSADVASLEEELLETVPDPGAEPPDAGMLGQAIDRFLQGESQDTQILFVRRYFYADSLRTLSRMSGKSEKALGMQLLRVRKKLKAYLNQEGFSV